MTRTAPIGNSLFIYAAHSDESGHRFRLKATTCSDPKRPLWPGVGLGGVIVADG